MISLFLRNVVFTILHPGLVAGVVPFCILGEKINETFIIPLQFYHYSGAIVFVIGLSLMLVCIVSFAIVGRGTLSPFDPTKKLVTTGLYRFSRNPMYVGVILILIGEAIIFQSKYLWIYSPAIFIVFNIFIIHHEEPRLRKDFGEEYNKYCQKVRRWI